MPEFNCAVESAHLLAIATIDDRMLILVDIENSCPPSAEAIDREPSALNDPGPIMKSQR
jgi:hypothetical protein